MCNVRITWYLSALRWSENSTARCRNPYPGRRACSSVPVGSPPPLLPLPKNADSLSGTGITSLPSRASESIWLSPRAPVRQRLCFALLPACAKVPSDLTCSTQEGPSVLITCAKEEQLCNGH